jgi:hypothetical protein
MNITIMSLSYHEEASNIFCKLINKWEKYKNEYIELFGEDEYYHYYQCCNDGDHTTFFDYTIELYSDTESCDENAEDYSSQFTNDNYGWNEYDKYY